MLSSIQLKKKRMIDFKGLLKCARALWDSPRDDKRVEIAEADYKAAQEEYHAALIKRGRIV